MADDRLTDRLDPTTFAGDPVVGVYEQGPDDDDALWVSERLFARLTAVAAGYELHTLPRLGQSDPVALNRARCTTLLTEVTSSPLPPARYLPIYSESIITSVIPDSGFACLRGYPRSIDVE